MIVWNTMVHDARVTKEAQTLARAGHNVCVYCLADSKRNATHETMEPGFVIRRVNRTPVRAFRTALPDEDAQKVPNSETVPALQMLVRPLLSLISLAVRLCNFVLVHLALLVLIVKSRPEMVHAHDVNTLPTGWLAARLSGAGLIYDAHEISGDREGYRKLRRAVFVVEKLLMPGAVAVITTTDMRAKYFARTYGRARPLVLQNRPRRAQHQHKDKTLLRLRFGITEDRPIILYQGGLQPGRGLEMLVRVAAQIEDAAFVLVGNGQSSGALSDMVVEMGLQERVFVLPAVPLDELPAITASADIGVQPIENTCLNHYTTDSNKLFEYLHAGLPVVASALPEVAKVIVPYGCGLIFKPGDSQALRAALETMVQDTAMRAECAENAEHAAAAYCWENQEQVLLKIYSPKAGNAAPSHEQ